MISFLLTQRFHLPGISEWCLFWKTLWLMERQGQCTCWAPGPCMWPGGARGHYLSFSEGGRRDPHKLCPQRCPASGGSMTHTAPSGCGNPLTSTHPGVSWGPSHMPPVLVILGPSSYPLYWDGWFILCSSRSWANQSQGMCPSFSRGPSRLCRGPGCWKEKLVQNESPPGVESRHLTLNPWPSLPRVLHIGECT